MCLTLFASNVTKASALELSARAAVLYDASSGRVLYSKDSDRQLAIASTTKIMTGILAVETMDFSKILTVKREHMSEGSSMYLREGEEISVEALVNGLMLVSGNDAASVLASYGGQNGKTFVEMMNFKAAELGLENTHFDNPHGLDSDSHYSSALDLAKLTDYAMKNPVFASIVKKKTDTMEGHSFKNHNRLLWQYEGADGVKTGFTTRAGRCLVSSAVRGGRRLIAVTIDAPNDWRDHKNLLDLGFSGYNEISLIKKGDCLFDMPLISGETPAAAVAADRNISVWLSDDEQGRVEQRIELPRFAYAPVHRGETAGQVVFFLDGEEIGRCRLVYSVSVGDGYVDRRNFLQKIIDEVCISIARR